MEPKNHHNNYFCAVSVKGFDRYKKTNVSPDLKNFLNNCSLERELYGSDIEADIEMLRRTGTVTQMFGVEGYNPTVLP